MEEKKLINISILDVIRILKDDRKKIAIYSCVAGVIGVLLAFGTPKVYKSTVILAPEESGSGFAGSISSLASMVGMNMKIGQTGDALYPEIYPDLMGSTGFVVGMFPIQVTKSKTGETYTYADYLQHHQRLIVLVEHDILIIDTTAVRFAHGQRIILRIADRGNLVNDETSKAGNLHVAHLARTLTTHACDILGVDSFVDILPDIRRYCHIGTQELKRACKAIHVGIVGEALLTNAAVGLRHGDILVELVAILIFYNDFHRE